MTCHEEGAEKREGMLCWRGRERSEGENGESSESLVLDLVRGALKDMAKWPLYSSPPPFSLDLGSGNPALGTVDPVRVIRGALRESP